MSATPSLVLVERGDAVATVTMNRPDAMNALSMALRRELVGALSDVAADDAIGAVVLTGAGRAFSAGVDLKELGGERPAGAGGGQATIEAPADLDVVGALRACPQPVIGAVNGVAITGGFEVALGCDLLVASSTARFADTHARVGIMPTWGITQRLPRLIGLARAKQLSFTGEFLDAETAERWGLVNRVVAPDELLDTCRRMAADIAVSDPRSVRALKRVYDQGADGTFTDGLGIERTASREHMRTVRPEDIAARRAAVQDRNRTLQAGQ